MATVTSHVFTPTHNRYDVLRVCLPRLALSCRNAGARLVAVDDRSDDPRVLPLLRAHVDEVSISEQRLMLDDWWWPRRRIAWLAHSRGLDRYLKVDDDVLVGPRAIGQWFAVADALPPERRGLLAAIAKRAPRADDPPPFADGGVRFRAQPGRGAGCNPLWHDCARVVVLAGRVLHVDDLLRALRYETGTNWVGIVDPQLEVQHLGLGCTVDEFWADRGGASFRSHYCVSGLTGDRVEVAGFDLDLWLACTRIGYGAVQAFADGAPPARAYVLAGASAPVRVLRGRDVVYLRRAVAANSAERRRSLILWTGLWQGNRTRVALGVGVNDPLVRICPDGHSHPWLKEKVEN